MSLLKDNSVIGNETGGAQQYIVPVGVHNIPATVPATGSASGSVVPNNGWQKLAVGITSSQPGQLQVQRYLDLAGTILQGPALSAALTAATPAVVNVTDGVPFLSYKVTVTNTSATIANTSNAQVIAQSA